MAASHEEELGTACQHSNESGMRESETDRTLAQMKHHNGLSALERTLSRNSPILDSLILQLPTASIFQLYHSSSFLRRLLQSCPLAWKHLSFRLAAPSVQLMNNNNANATPSADDAAGSRSKNYALDQLLLWVVNPFSSNLKSLELDNTAVSGQILTSTVLLMRRETLEHLSVRGCKNVSLKYHINPYLNVFGLQHEVTGGSASGRDFSKMALKSLYTYRCRHHRRRPYLPSSLSRRDSDSEPTHELVTLCHKLGIWTDTAWCTTPGNRCHRRRNYVQMRVPNGTPEVWVVFDRLWRSRNWLGLPEGYTAPRGRDGRFWEQDEHASNGEALGVDHSQPLQEGKATPAHLRHSHTEFVQDVNCDQCGDSILERCEQCSVLMHCAGCRKTLCASCAFDRPYAFRRTPEDRSTPDTIWWAPGHTVSPCIIAEPPPNPMPANGVAPPPGLNFKWCCTSPVFSGGGGMSFAPGVAREAERVRASPLPRGQGWEDPEFLSNPIDASGGNGIRAPPPQIPEHLSDNDRAHIVSWLLGPPGRPTIDCPRNLCMECFEQETWKVHCKQCSKPLCMEHDLRGLKLRICGLKDLSLEKVAVREQAARAALTRATQTEVARSIGDGPVTSALQLNPGLLSSSPPTPLPVEDQDLQLPLDLHTETPQVNSGPDQTPTLNVPLHQPIPSRPLIQMPASPASSVHGRPPSAGSMSTVPSRGSSPASVFQENSTTTNTAPNSTTPSWSGCLSFFCPSFRSHGDQRPRCSSSTALKECSSCSTFVCPECVSGGCGPALSSAYAVSATHATSAPIYSSSTGCACSTCQNSFYCPNCQRKRVESGECLRMEEERKAAKERERKKREEEAERKAREKHDHMLGLAGDFWEGMETEASGFGGDNETGMNTYLDEDGFPMNIGDAEANVMAEVLGRYIPRFRVSNEGAMEVDDAGMSSSLSPPDGSILTGQLPLPSFDSLEISSSMSQQQQLVYSSSTVAAPAPLPVAETATTAAGTAAMASSSDPTVTTHQHPAPQ